MLNNFSTEVGQQITREAPVPGFVQFDHILHCLHCLYHIVYFNLSAWLAAKKKGQHPGW